MPKIRIIQLIFGLLSFALSFFVWHYAADSIDITAALDLVRVAVPVVLFIALLLLAAVLFPARAVCLIFGAFLAGFILFAGARWEYLLGAFLSFLLAASLIIRIKRQMSNQINFRFYQMSRHGAPQILTAIALLFALVGYFYPFNFADIQIPAGVFNSITPFIESMVGSIMPNYQKGMTVDQFISAGAPDALGGVKDKAQKKAVLAALDREIKNQRDNLSAQIGVKLTGKEILPDIARAATNTYLSRYLVRYKNVAPIAIAVFVFLTIKSFGFIINRLAVLFAWLFAKILLALNIIRKQKISVDKEILTV